MFITKGGLNNSSIFANPTHSFMVPKSMSSEKGKYVFFISD